MNGKSGDKVHLYITDLLFKIKDGRATKYEWRVNGEEINPDGVHYKDDSEHKDGRDKNTYGLQFDSKFKGKYECVVSTAEEPILSTAVEVIVDSGKCAVMLCALVCAIM